MEKDKKTIVLVDGLSEYSVVKDDQTYYIYYSDAEHWATHLRGSLVFKITETDEGYKFTQKKKNTLEYSESLILYFILAQEYENYKIEIGELKTL